MEQNNHQQTNQNAYQKPATPGGVYPRHASPVNPVNPSTAYGYAVPNHVAAPLSPSYPVKQKKSMPVGLIVFLAILGAMVVFGFGVLMHSAFGNVKSSSNSDAGEPTKPNVEQYDSLKDNALKPGVDSGNNDLIIETEKHGDETLSTTEISKLSENSVLGISVYSTDGILQGEGSGIVAGTDSKNTKTYIITCAHVIDNEKAVYKIVDNSGKEYLAAIVGFDASHDVGVLSVEKVGFNAVTFGDSSQLQSGETVVAVGNPGGSEFYGSVTQGIVSATDRMLSVSGQSIECIQHDAAINPGSSGGALFNEYGQVVGMNYSKVTMENYEGMNFAVPSNTFVERANKIIAESLKTYGAKVGVEYYVAASYFDENYKQLVIRSIDEKSDLYGKAAEGDFIIAVNGEKITDKYSIIKIVNEKEVGDTITLTIAHKNEKTNDYDTQDITVKLIERSK